MSGIIALRVGEVRQLLMFLSAGEEPGATDDVPGFVNLATPGVWARVYHRGKDLGTTPGRFELPAGKQRLRLQLFRKGRSVYVTVNVFPNRTVKVTRKIGRQRKNGVSAGPACNRTGES